MAVLLSTGWVATEAAHQWLESYGALPIPFRVNFVDDDGQLMDAATDDGIYYEITGVASNVPTTTTRTIRLPFSLTLLRSPDTALDRISEIITNIGRETSIPDATGEP